MSRALIVLYSDADRDRAITWIRKAPQATRVEFQETKRTLPQNAKMWAALSDVSRQVLHMGRRYPPDVWKVLFLCALGQEMQFIPALDGVSFVPLGYRSSELSKDEMSELLELIAAWGAEHGVIFHDPETKRGADGTATGPIEPGTNPAALQSQTKLTKELT